MWLIDDNPDIIPSSKLYFFNCTGFSVVDRKEMGCLYPRRDLIFSWTKKWWPLDIFIGVRLGTLVGALSVSSSYICYQGNRRWQKKSHFSLLFILMIWLFEPWQYVLCFTHQLLPYASLEGRWGSSLWLRTSHSLRTYGFIHRNLLFYDNSMALANFTALLMMWTYSKLWPRCQRSAELVSLKT